jgi:AmmeMemoRadiSam system protein A
MAACSQTTGGSAQADGAAHALEGGCSPAERAALLDLARAAIRAAIAGDPPPPLPEVPPRLRVPAGVFVSLHDAGGDLRGCVGSVLPNTPIAVLVGRMAVASAMRDPRFPPLATAELASLRIEISVLAPLRAIDPADIDPPRHGLCLRLGHRGAVFLPQVAARHGWDRDTLLRQLCDKAGLPLDAWSDERVTLQAFTVEAVEDVL